MIFLLIIPRRAALPFERWLPELRGELVAVAAAGVELTDGFAEVVTVPDWNDTGLVLAAARDLAARYGPRAVLGPAEFDVERAAVLRGELGLPGLDTVAAEAYR